MEIMRLTWKDAGATLAVAAAVALYVGYLTDNELAVVTNPRALAAVVLVLGVAACAIGGSMLPTAKGQPPTPGADLFSFFGTLAFVSALAAIVTGSEALLAALVAMTVLLWIAATTRHLVTSRRTRKPRVEQPVARGREGIRHD